MGQGFDVSVIIRVLFFSVIGRKNLTISIFDRAIVFRGIWRLKTWFIVYFESLFGGPDKFILSVKFSFSFEVNRSVLFDFV